jgi:glycosyltransferase involved in cell wall biosynthesis
MHRRVNQSDMRILIDGYNLTRPQGTGVATYGRNHIKALQLLGHEVGVVFGAEQSAAKIEAQGLSALLLQRAPLAPVRRLRRIMGGALAVRGFDAERLPVCEAQLEEGGLIPTDVELWNSKGLYAYAIGAFRKLGVFSELMMPGVDIAHWTYPLPLRVAGAINVYTIHDLVPLLRPDMTLDGPRRFARLSRAVAAKADHLLTVSEGSRQDIIEHLGVAPERVTNTYQPHSIDSETAAQAKFDVSACEEFGLTRDGYFIFFGAIEPKKNLPRLLEAYFQSGSTTPLVLAGAGGWMADEQLAPLLSRRETAAGKRVILTGYLPRSKLLALVSGAKATLFPSLYEGFGLPALEAMALGSPVMASTIPGLGEVVGDAAKKVDPLNVAEMAQAIAQLDGNAELRNKLSSAGLRRAVEFSMASYSTRLNALLWRLAK